MKSALDGTYALFGLYQRTHWFAGLTRLISDHKLVRKYHTRALSMKYFIYSDFTHQALELQ